MDDLINVALQQLDDKAGELRAPDMVVDGLTLGDFLGWVDRATNKARLLGFSQPLMARESVWRVAAMAAIADATQEQGLRARVRQCKELDELAELLADSVAPALSRLDEATIIPSEAAVLCQAYVGLLLETGLLGIREASDLRRGGETEGAVLTLLRAAVGVESIELEQLLYEHGPRLRWPDVRDIATDQHQDLALRNAAIRVLWDQPACPDEEVVPALRTFVRELLQRANSDRLDDRWASSLLVGLAYRLFRYSQRSTEDEILIHEVYRLHHQQEPVEQWLRTQATMSGLVPEPNHR